MPGIVDFWIECCHTIPRTVKENPRALTQESNAPAGMCEWIETCTDRSSSWCPLPQCLLVDSGGPYPLVSLQAGTPMPCTETFFRRHRMASDFEHLSPRSSPLVTLFLLQPKGFCDNNHLLHLVIFFADNFPSRLCYTSRCHRNVCVHKF